jgi:2'-5' RNA ligase
VIRAAGGTTSVQLVLDGIDAAPRLTDGLFFAVFPGASAASGDCATGASYHRDHRVSGRLLEPHRLHVTLLGLGSHAGVPVKLITLAKSIAGTVRCGSFDIEFDRVTGFGAPGHQSLMVLRGANGLQGVRQLQSALFDSVRGVLARRGMRRAFEPHVTLLYGDKCVPEIALEPVRWHVTEFVLVHSPAGKEDAPNARSLATDSVIVVSR